MIRRSAPPVVLRMNDALQNRRWVLWPDRILCESSALLWGWSTDLQIRFDEVTAVYRYRKARPFLLLAWALTIPLAILFVWIAQESELPWVLVLAVIFGLLSVFVGWAGIRRRPHILIQSRHFRREIPMDKPWHRPAARRQFFVTLSNALRIPPLYP